MWVIAVLFVIYFALEPLQQLIWPRRGQRHRSDRVPG